MKDNLYPIGALAEKAQVNIQTIRYYERIKLLAPKARRNEKRIRFYDDESLQTLQFIKHAQDLGFQLLEIKDLLKLRGEKIGRCERVRKRASEKLENVKAKIQSLKGIEKTLMKLIKECEDKKSEDACPILEGMETKNE